MPRACPSFPLSRGKQGMKTRCTSPASDNLASCILSMCEHDFSDYSKSNQVTCLKVPAEGNGLFSLGAALFEHGTKFLDEIVDVLEFAVDGGKADKSDLIEFAELFDHQLTNHA